MIRTFAHILPVVLLAACIGQHDTTLPLDQQPQDQTGELDVSAATSGNNPDLDGYRVTINEERSQTVSSNGHTLFSGLQAASYQVQLSEVSTNCTVADNPKTVTVYAGATSNAAFVVHCS